MRRVEVAVISASENTKAALGAVGILPLFDAIVDGIVVKGRHLAGEPAPDSFLEGARVLGVESGHCVVLEDALAGVHDYAEELRARGADLVVTSLTALGTAT